MKALPYFLALASVVLLAFTMFLWLIVPRWIMVWMNSNVKLSSIEVLLVTLSNLARTSIGVFATLILFGIIGLVLIWSLVWKRKN